MQHGINLAGRTGRWTISRKKKLSAKIRATMSGAKPEAMVRDYDSHVLVCSGGDCKKRGAKDVRKAFKGELRDSGLLGDVRMDTTDCLGLCKHGPNIVVYDGAEPKGTWYVGLSEAGVPEVVDQHLKKGEPVERLAADRRPRKAKNKKG